MKQITTIILLCCCSVIFAQDTTVSARDRAKYQLALRAVAQKIKDIIESPPAPDEAVVRQMTGELNSCMQQNISAHADPATSRKLCIEVLREQHRHTVKRRIDDSLKQAVENSALPMDRAEVMRHVGSGWDKSVAISAEKFAENNIGATFSKARKQSVALQRDGLKDRIKMPAEDDLNQYLKKLATQSGHHPPHIDELDAMTEWLESFDDNAPLFKEVRHSNREVSERIVQRIKSQYTHQLESIANVAKSLPREAIDSETIQVALHKAVESETEKMRLESKKSNPGSRIVIYNPFEVVHEKANQMAETMQEDRLAAAIVDQKNLPISEGDVESIVLADQKAYVSAKDGRQLLVRRYAAEITPWLINELSVRAGRGGDTQFCARLDAIIKKSARLAKVIEAHTGKKLDSMLPGIRGRIMTNQLQAVFGTAPEATEVLTMEAVHAIWAAGDYAKITNFNQAWESLKVAGVILGDADKDNMLEETRAQIVGTANRLIPIALLAMRKQESVLGELEKVWESRLRKDVESGRSVDEITTDWTDELNRRWSVYADKHKLPYPDLFSRTIDLLEKTVRKLYESVEAELEAAESETQPTEPTPEEEEPVEEPPPPEETPEDSTETTIEEMLEKLDFVLYFRDTKDGQSEAVLLDGSGVSTKLIFDPGDVNSAVEDVYKTVIPAIESVAVRKAKKSPKRKGVIALLTRDRTLDLKMAVLVGSKQVRHMTSILLRNRVELFVKDWNANPANPAIELEWEDNLEIAQ